MSLGPRPAKNVISRRSSIFYEINHNRTLTILWLNWRELYLDRLHQLLRCCELLTPFLSRQPAMTGVPSLPGNRRMVQERIFMSTTQPSLVGQRPESKLFPRSELICEDNYIYGSLYNFFPLRSVYPEHRLAEYNLFDKKNTTLLRGHS